MELGRDPPFPSVFVEPFLLGPAAILLVAELAGQRRRLTLGNYRAARRSTRFVESYGLSVRISLVTAVVGGVFGFLLAWAVIYGGLPRVFRSLLTTFSGVASNFAGVPLAAAFIFTLGRIGLVTALFGFFGFDLYQSRLLALQLLGTFGRLHVLPVSR